MASKGNSLQTLVTAFTCKLLILLLFLTHSTLEAKTADLKVQMVQFLIRHGDRTPVKAFANDKWRHVWTEGWGELTRVGMQQQYNTGLYLRKRYEKLINDTDDYKNVIYMRSTDINRNLMSASFNLAGFLQPEGSAKLKENICWEPIPIHRVPAKHDYLLSFFSECPKLQTNFFHSPHAETIVLKYKDLIDLLMTKLGLTKRELLKIYLFADAIFVQEFHNFSLPEWITESVLADIKDLATDFFSFMVQRHDVRRLRGGPLLGEMIKSMEKVMANRNDGYKIYSYLGHDITIVSLFSAMDIFEPHSPFYCSTVMMELLRGAGDDYYVKILYRNDTSREPYELSLKDCSSPCPFETFKRLTLPMVPTDILSECLP